jgi:hypothetical protein
MKFKKKNHSPGWHRYVNPVGECPRDFDDASWPAATDSRTDATRLLPEFIPCKSRSRAACDRSRSQRTFSPIPHPSTGIFLNTDFQKTIDSDLMKLIIPRIPFGADTNQRFANFNLLFVQVPTNIVFDQNIMEDSFNG